MEGIKLDKRQWSWLNDNDAYFVFTDELKEKFKRPEPENEIQDWDQYVEFLNEQLFEVYQHVLVTPDNRLFGWDGLSYHQIGKDLQDIYEGALVVIKA